MDNIKKILGWRPTAEKKGDKSMNQKQIDKIIEDLTWIETELLNHNLKEALEIMEQTIKKIKKT